MDRRHQSTPRTYTEDELAGLFATYFGDKLTQTQLDSLVAAVAASHAARRERAAQQHENTAADLPPAQPAARNT
jgi:hypothetical protein